MRHKAVRFLLRMGLAGCIIGVSADFINLAQQVGLRGLGDSPEAGVVFESYPPNPLLPECLTGERYRAEAEPAFYLNWFEWAVGVGALEESAYRQADARILEEIRAGEQGARKATQGKGGIAGEQISALGFKLIRRTFYFDRRGYHALVEWGRALDLRKTEANPSCAIDLKGSLFVRTISRPFTCKTFYEVLNSEIRRIAASDSVEQCWVSYTYEIDPLNLQIHFEEEYATKNSAREVSDSALKDL